jgi:hypothetical protein
MTEMDPETRKRAVELRNEIINKKTGDAQKRARAKEPSLRQIKNITQALTTTPHLIERPTPELRKPTDADLFSPEEALCHQLLISGYVDSFSDFFKITHPKSPGSYHYEYWRTYGEDNAIPPPPVVPPAKYEFLQGRLVEAENARRRSQDGDLARAYTEISQYFQSCQGVDGFRTIFSEKTFSKSETKILKWSPPARKIV